MSVPMSMIAAVMAWDSESYLDDTRQLKRLAPDQFHQNIPKTGQGSLINLWS
ncbi:hypothetical protein [Synechococcus sp. PCC 6312]|uniref:hypothetical protein n=1 Tax=Synechococcus sp. (strain ATCC 27167 / PCC 6312) TaxID=195253 RepID=UPI00029EF85C|nr:hypothetical protein [Synechococcus sp. PCC 6312]AFY60918.1 hypothetical protein Syn6312_1772 [Synechococcus sp. PCC 6312]